MLDGEDITLPCTVLEPQDDPAFLAIVDHIIAALVCQDRPDEVYLVHIDNWFDRKWLRYSGYGVVAFHGSPWVFVAKEEHRQEQLTFPPFTPNRVVAQYFFGRVADVSYEEQAPAHLIHRLDRQRSAKNLHRRVTDFSQSGLFIWYSSGSVANRRGSLMVYSVRQDAVAAWYAGFSDHEGWRLEQTEGIGRETVALLMGGELPVQPD